MGNILLLIGRKILHFVGRAPVKPPSAVPAIPDVVLSSTSSAGVESIAVQHCHILR
jgi:hypothetical protein